MRVYDPHIQIGEIYGSNQRFIMNAIPHIGHLLDASLDAMLDWADHVLVAQKPSPEYAAAILRSGLPVLDLTASFSGPAAPAGPHA